MTRFASVQQALYPAIVFALVARPSLVFAQDSKLERATLVGLPGVGVSISLSTDPSAGLSESTIRTDVELKLRQARIRVFDDSEELHTPGYPELRVTVVVAAAEGGSYASYATSADLLQSVVLGRDYNIRFVEARTWSAGLSTGYAPRRYLEDRVRSAVRDLVDEFVNAYLATHSNPP